MSARRKRHTPAQVVRKLQEADRLVAAGADAPEIARQLGVSEQTYYRWRNQFGELNAHDAKRLRELERENATLKRPDSAGAAAPQARRVVYTTRRCRAHAPNVVWAIDFQYDSTTDGRPIKILSAVDEHTREHVTMGVVPMVDTHLAKEKARTGDLDGAIEVCRSVVDDEFDTGDMLYRGLPATVLVESLLRLRALVARAHGDEVPTGISWSFTG